MPIEALQRHYGDLTEVGRSSDGTRYSGTLPDGTPVHVIELAPALAGMLRDRPQFFATLERASLIRHDAVLGPVSWGGHAADAPVHIAFRKVEASPVAPGAASGTVAALGRELLGALEAIHAAGLAHGAITPTRVLAWPGGHVLGEFGLVAALVAGGVEPRAATTAVSDEPYMSPDARAGSVPDARSDVFAMGTVLYEILTEKPPFGGRTTAYVLASVLADDADATSDEAASPVVQAILRAIEPAPEDRWPTARAFAQALSAGLPDEPTRERTRAFRGRGCLPVTMAASALVAIAALFRALY